MPTSPCAPPGPQEKEVTSRKVPESLALSPLGPTSSTERGSQMETMPVSPELSFELCRRGPAVWRVSWKEIFLGVWDPRVT